MKSYFKDSRNFNTSIFYYTYKIEVLKVNSEIDAYYISAYLIAKYNPIFNTLKHHYKTIKPPNYYNESNWKLIKILKPDLIPVTENTSFLKKYFLILILLLIPLIAYISKKII